MSPYSAQLAVGIAILVAYLFAVYTAAVNYIRLANLRWLQAHQAALRGRLTVQSGDPAPPPAAGAVLDAVDVLVPAPEANDGGGRRPWRDLWSLGNWTGSCEIASWVKLHEAQRLEVWRLPPEVVQARFSRAMGQIDELSAVRRHAWLHRWNELQLATRDRGANGSTVRQWRAELSQLLAELFNARDSTYNQLVSLYGKAGWLVLAAYFPVVALLIAGYGYVLLAGFLGGLVSRMQRIVYGRGLPTAYGTSWVPLFIAPLLGALAAWAGLHLLSLLQALNMVGLDGVLPADVTFQAPTVPILGLATLLGFSERFFNRVGSQADSVIGLGAESGSAAAAGSPTASFPPPDAQNGAANARSNGANSASNSRRRSSP